LAEGGCRQPRVIRTAKDQDSVVRRGVSIPASSDNALAQIVLWRWDCGSLKIIDLGLTAE
jgi:hypothetical protein